MKIKVLFLTIFALHLTGFYSVAALGVSPDKAYYDATPGQTLSDEIKIIGEAELKEPQNLYIKVMGMRKAGEDDLREFYSPEINDFREPANWVKLSRENIQVSAGEVALVPWSLKVPSNATCGTKLIAIMVSTQSESMGGSGNRVVFENNIVSQIHLDIKKSTSKSCPNRPSLKIKEFKVEGLPIIIDPSMVNLTTRIENSSNIIARRPEGTITISNSISSNTIDLNPEGLDIYPNTTRKFPTLWIDPKYPTRGSIFEQIAYEISSLRIGLFTARLEIQEYENASASINFLVLPVKSLAFVASLSIVCFILYRYVKNKNISQKN
jgi:hypothetical protein